MAIGSALADFYPRPPRGGRPPILGIQYSHARFLSTPSARRATTGICKSWKNWEISIHALREEGDLTLTGGDPLYPEFLSTPSARRATQVSIPTLSPATYFYPRPPRGGRPFSQYNICIAIRIFLSTPSARRATAEPTQGSWGYPYFYPRPPRGGRLASKP